MAAIEPLYANLVKDPEATKVGELADGTPIWEKEFVVKVGEEPVVMNGQAQWVMAGQTPVKPRMRAVMEKVRKRYTEVQQPNGGVFRNFDFAPDPEELARLEARKAEAALKDDLAREMSKRGVSAADLLDAIQPKRGRKAE